MAKKRKDEGGFNRPFTDLALSRRKAAARPSPSRGRSSEGIAPTPTTGRGEAAQCKATDPDDQHSGTEVRGTANEGVRCAAHQAREDDRADAHLFMAAVGDVEQLQERDRRVRGRQPKIQSRPDEDEAALQQLKDIVSGRGNFRVFESEEDHSGLAPGVSFQILNDLRRGRFACRRHVDLHGLTRDQARAVLSRFITTARRDDQRCVLIITGRGRKSPGGLSVLREALPRWLSRNPLRPHVLAYCTARAEDGGPGAFYVLLRRAGVKPFGAPQ